MPDSPPGRRIPIFGSSGSGTTTLGRALAGRLSVPQFDTDDGDWLSTARLFAAKRMRFPARVKMERGALLLHSGQKTHFLPRHLALADTLASPVLTLDSAAPVDHLAAEMIAALEAP